jgi:hypothetical protein
MTVRALPSRPDASGWPLAILRLIPYPARVSQSSRSLQFLLRIFAVPARDRVSLYRSQARPSNRMSTFRWSCFRSLLRWSEDARFAIDLEEAGASCSDHHHAPDRAGPFQ